MQSLRLFHVRSYERSEVDFSPGTSLLLGRNGEGKTTIVEAIHYLVTLKSFRTAQPRELIKANESVAKIEGTFSEHESRVEIHPRKRTLERDGKQATTQAFTQGVSVVALAPEHRELLFGRPQSRRDYLDRILFSIDPTYLSIAQSYRRALSHKQAILHSDLPSEVYFDHVAPWNEALVRAGEEIRRRRSELASELQRLVAHWHQEIASSELTSALSYHWNEEDLNEALKEKGKLEHSIGRTLVGPHRDQLLIQLNGRPVSEVASQGEGASILLALKMAEIERINRETPPILLFDDIGATLDPPRRERLFERITRTHQAIFTTPDPAIAEAAAEKGAKILRRSDERSVSHWL